jgi:cyclohexa-1,5-dienecarbonyl-CoA hydratase
VALAQVPVAALVEGPCLGGAFELALACHLVFATPKATFGCPEIKLGVFPPVLAAIGAQQLGGAVADRLVLTGGDLSAAEAKATGWLTLLIEEGDPKEVVRTWYRDNLAPLSAFSLRRATWAARHAGGMFERLGEPLARAEKHYLEVLVPSHDGNEGIAAFLERRKPSWRHA